MDRLFCGAALDDCLFGGFGLEVPCKIIWEDSKESRVVLGTKCLVEWCKNELNLRERKIEQGEDVTHEEIEWFINTIEKAKSRNGLTMLDIIVDTIRSVSKRATAEEIMIELILT